LIDFDQKKLGIGFYDLENLCLPFYITQNKAETIKTSDIDGNFPKRQAETPKEKRLWFGSRFGHFHLCYRGDKFGNPLKVNIS